MSAVAGEVLPTYSGRVVFVDALTDTGSGPALADRLGARFIPTSVFVGGDGAVRDTVIGPMSAEDLRTRLDALAGR